MRLRRYAAAAGRRLAGEGGYSLSELVIVLAILLIIVGALTQLFVSGSTAQVDMTRRFEAQQNMRLALDKLRREIHCANTVTGAPGTSIVISLGSYCPSNGTVGVAQITWCTRDKNDNPPPGAGAPYALWRYKGPNCTGTDRRKEADYLKIPNVFAGYPPPSAGSLPTLSVVLPVDLTPADPKQLYKLEDNIVLRNGTRAP
jgi:type II secretory pathway pseudopilin PulG